VVREQQAVAWGRSRVRREALKLQSPSLRGTDRRCLGQRPSDGFCPSGELLAFEQYRQRKSDTSSGCWSHELFSHPAVSRT